MPPPNPPTRRQVVQLRIDMLKIQVATAEAEKEQLTELLDGLPDDDADQDGD